MSGKVGDVKFVLGFAGVLPRAAFFADGPGLPSMAARSHLAEQCSASRYAPSSLLRLGGFRWRPAAGCSLR